MADLELGVATMTDADSSMAIKLRVAEARDRYERIDGMPTRPLDPAMRRRFRTRNLGLLLPVAAKMVGKSGPWKEIADALSRLGN